MALPNPIEILIKASNGASDFGNKFGQPLSQDLFSLSNIKKEIINLVMTKLSCKQVELDLEKKSKLKKAIPKKGDRIIIVGGDNYTIGMGGAAVSSADTGAFGSSIELNAIQRSNPEMQKRVANAHSCFE